MKRVLLAVCLLSVFLAAGCTQTGLLKIEPGLVDVTSPAAQPGISGRWTFWIRNVVDERGELLAGRPGIGTLDQRFAEANTTVELEQAPADYLRNQLSRFLLNRGMEASSQEKAAVYLDVYLTRFTVSRDSSTVLDKILFDVDYRVVFTAHTGEEIGTVRLPDGRWIKGVSLFGSKAKIEALMRESLADSFKKLSETEIYSLAAAKK